MFGIIDKDAANPIVFAARRVLFRTRMHSIVLSPDDLTLPYEIPLRALIILRPEQIPDLEALVARVRAQFPTLPLALFLRKTNRDGNLYVYRRLADFVYDDDVQSDTLISELLCAYTARAGKSEGRIAGGLCLDRGRQCATVYGLPILYSESEWMLLFYLLQISPRAASAAELAKTALRPAPDTEPHTAVSHISRINRKSEGAISSYRPIENRGKEGYALRLF